MRNSVVPFLNIPRWPEEQGVSPADAPLDGVPLCADDSIFSLSDPELQLNREISRDAHDFALAESKNRRHHLMRAVVSKFIEDPLKFEAYADQLSTMQAGGDAEISQFGSELFGNLRHYSMQPDRYTEKSLAGWLELMVRRNSYHEQAGAVLSGMFVANKGEKAVVNFLYTLSSAGLRSGLDRDDPEVIRLLAGILCFDHNILPLHSNHHQEFWIAMFSPDDDVLKKRFEVGAAQNFLGLHLAAQAHDLASDSNSVFMKWPETTARLNLLKRQDPRRLHAIVEFIEAGTIEAPAGKGFVTYPPEVLNSWPANFVFVENGNLREALNEFATKENGNIAAIWLPNRGNMVLDCAPRGDASLGS